MLKVLIADDEEKVCWLIEKLIDWQGLAMELCACVHDGVTAYQTILAQRPDIVITDIRMPEMDGLEMIRRTLESGAKTTFVVISGHRQFEYAYSALKYGVEDYLLKPIKRVELNHILARIGERFRQQQLFAEGQQQQDALFSSRSQLLRQQFMTALVQNNLIPDSFASVDRDFGFHLSGCVCYACEIHVDVGLNCIGQARTDFVCLHLRDMLMEQLGSAMQDVEALLVDGSVLVLMGATGTPPHAALKELLKKAKQYADAFDCYTVSVSVSDAVSDAGALPEAMRQARSLLDGRLILGSDRLLLSGMCTQQRTNKETLFPHNERRLLRQYIETNHIAGCRELILRLFDQAGKRKIAAQDYYVLCTLISEGFYQILAQHIWTEELIRQDRTELAEYVRNAAHAYELAQMLAERMGALLIRSEKQRLQQGSKPVRIARKLIAEGYGEALTLERVAAQAGLNSAYFSFLFKQETGKNFSEYLTETRIENARKLLESTDATIAGIAQSVGYHDVKYFSKLFTKTVGLTPAKYRKLHS